MLKPEQSLKQREQLTAYKICKLDRECPPLQPIDARTCVIHTRPGAAKSLDHTEDLLHKVNAALKWLSTP